MWSQMKSVEASAVSSSQPGAVRSSSRQTKTLGMSALAWMGPLMAGFGMMMMAGCGHKDAAVQVLMTDAPAADADAVYVNVVETRVHFTPVDDRTATPGVEEPSPTPVIGEPTPTPIPDEEDSAWITISSQPESYDLLTLQNNVTAALGDANLGPGYIDQVRLVLDAENPGAIVVEGVTYPLTVPSGSESGLKVKGDIELREDMTTVVLIDFDAEKSVVQTGNGSYQLKPVISVKSVTYVPGLLE